MEDAGNELTEQALTALEGQIKRIYAQAAKELGETINAYFDAFRERDEKMKKIIGTVRNGREWTEEDYKQWRLNQIGRGKRFEALRDKLANRVTEANEVAVSYVNDKTPGIYSLNRNYTAYEIEGIYGADFTLLDEQTVKRLVKDAPDLMPYYPEEKAIKRGFDLKFGKQQITAGVTSGILRGSSIPQMEKDLRNRIVTMSQVSSIRAARTAVTQTQNAGRMAGYQAAADMGIPVQKRWVCVKDFRTRWDHGMADGQVVSYDEAFTVGGYKMMYPGDESHGAPGHELYNCRCRTVTGHDLEFEAEPRQMRVKNPETGEYELVNELTYEQWYKAKQEENPEAFSGWVKAGKNYQADQREYAQYQQLLGKKAPKTFAAYQNMKYNSSEEWKALQVQKREIIRDEKNRAILKEKIDSGELPLVVSSGKQRKHIPGTNEYKTYLQQRLKNGKNPQSILTIQEEEIDDIVKEFSTTGKITIRTNTDGSKKIVEYVTIGKAVGKCYPESGYEDTERIAIHYSKKGYHVFPVAEKENSND